MVSFFLALACIGGSEPELSQPPEPARPDLPNIVLITLDTTRADALSAYGNPEPTSPNFDFWAGKGLLFEWAFSHSPTTLSAHASLFTGLDPHGHAIPRNGFPLAPEFTTLTEHLRSQGYDTIGVVGASVLNREMGMDQGFRLFDDTTPIDMVRRHEDRADSVTRRALNLVEKREKNNPLFLWVHYYDAHSPYDAPRDYQARFVDPNYRPTIQNDLQSRRLAEQIRAGTFTEKDKNHLLNLYKAEINWTDHQMGRLLENLEQEGLLANSLLAITADHGEAFLDGKSNPLGHGHDIEQWATHIPLVITGTGAYRTEARRLKPVVKISDIPNTLLSLANMPTVIGRGQDLSLLIEAPETASDPVFMEASKPKRGENTLRWNNIGKEQGVVDGDFLFTHNPQQRPIDRLYTLQEPGVIQKNPEELERLKKLLMGWNEQAPPFRDENFSDEMHQALKALGYLE